MSGGADQGLQAMDLVRVAQSLEQRIAEGLARDGAELRALPAWLPPPSRGLSGAALAVDLGGTHLRAAVVELGAGGSRLLSPLYQRVLPLHELRDAEGFFDLQAELVAELGGLDGLPVGYCFSYPATPERSGDARLLRWTKGVDIPALVGAEVGLGLTSALRRRGLRPGRVCVLNDTVAALLSGCARAPGRPEHVIGLIVGTGTNMALMLPVSKVPKLGGQGEELVAINLESGAHHPEGLSPVDDALDRRSLNPGAQRWEKAVSGAYLPGLAALLEPELPEARSAGALVERRGSGGPGARVAAALLERSAGLVAAGVAAAARFYPRGEAIGLAAEGGLFWGAPRYAVEVVEKLKDLGHPEVVLLPEASLAANLSGAAAAALGSCA